MKANIAGRIAKYLATSFAIENVVRAPRVIRSCLPTSTISISFVGFESRSTMFPASFAAVVPVFIATPTSACASAGASLVPSPVIATIRPLACSSLIRAIFASGVASARKSSTPASWAITAAVTRLSPVIITVRMPILRSSSKRSFMPPLTMSLRWMTPSAQLSRATTSGVPPCSATLWTIWSSSAGARPPCSSMKVLTASAAPLRISVPFMSIPLIRVWAVKGTKLCSPSSRSRTSKRSFASTTIERPSGVSSASEASWATSASSRSSTPGTGRNSVAWRLPSVIVPVLSSRSTSTSPEASTARPDIASTLRCTRRSIPAMPIAERSAPIVVGISATSSAISTVCEVGVPA